MGTLAFGIALAGVSLGGLALGSTLLRRGFVIPRFGDVTRPVVPADYLLRLRTLEARLDRLEADRRASPPATEPNRAAEPRARTRRLDRRAPTPSEGPVLIAVPDLASSGTLNSAEAFAEFHRRFEPVWTLADRETPDDEIARQTGYPIGQVELILGLRPRDGGPSASLDRDSAPSRGDSPHA